MKYFLGIILAVVVVALVFRLTRKGDEESVPDLKNGSVIVATQPTAMKHTVTVEEVIQATSYTYMRVKEGRSEYWIATVKDDVASGDSFSYNDALEMSNFHSKDLDRTFPTIFFISEDQTAVAGEPAGMMAPTTMGKPKVELKAEEVIPQSAGGTSVGELYKNRDSFSNKKVKVKGKVAKVNNEVMDRNWVHIQDGTSDSGNFDLTVTTLEFVQVDDIVEFEGTIILNKDFGAGYVYEVIMEGGTIKK